MALQPLWALASFQFPALFTINRTLWTSDQLVARTLPKHRTAQTKNKHIYTPNIHVLNGIRTHDHSIRASEDSSCLRPLGYRDRRLQVLMKVIFNFLRPMKIIYINEYYDIYRVTELRGVTTQKIVLFMTPLFNKIVSGFLNEISQGKLRGLFKVSSFCSKYVIRHLSITWIFSL
jgi:hypothetical protein